MNGRDFSLLAKYDEFCRGFRGCMSAPYYEFEDFVRSQEDNRKKWLSIQDKCATVLKDLKEAQSHKEKLELQIQHVTEMLKNEVQIRQRVEREEKNLEKKLGFVKHIVTADRNMTGETRDRILSLSSIDLSHRYDFESTRNNLVDTMSEDIECSTRSILSSLDITSDKTDDDLELSTLRSIRDVKSRRSTELLDAMHPKGILKGIHADGDAPRLSLTVDTTGVRNLKLGIGQSQHQTPDLLKVPVIEVSSSQNIEEIDLDSTTIGSPTDVDTSSQSTPVKEPIRQHNFVSKVILKQELCVPCNARIRFGKSAMKCADCFATCHVDCKDKMPTPCSPGHRTPTQAKVTLAECATRSSTVVPTIITNCVNEIEARGIGYSSLYRTDAHEKEIACVKEQILQARLHADQLRSTNINVLAGVLRSFLLSLNEPLITFAARESFCKLCYINRIAEVQDAVCSLLREFPDVNRATLAYLMLHFQRVTNGTVCSTPLPSLAKYFASALFGGPLSPITDGLKKLQDLKEQQLVKTHFINLLSPRDSLSTLSPMVPDKATEKLISLPIDFWQKITSASNEINSPVYKAKRNLKKGFFTSPHF